MTLLQLFKVIKPWVWDPKFMMQYVRAAGIVWAVTLSYFAIMHFVFSDTTYIHGWEGRRLHFWGLIIISLALTIWVNLRVEKRDKNKKKEN